MNTPGDMLADLLEDAVDVPFTVAWPRALDAVLDTAPAGLQRASWRTALGSRREPMRRVHARARRLNLNR